MKLSELLSKPFKLKGGGILNLKGFSKRVIDKEIGGSNNNVNEFDKLFHLKVPKSSEYNVYYDFSDDNVTIPLINFSNIGENVIDLPICDPNDNNFFIVLPTTFEVTDNGVDITIFDNNLNAVLYSSIEIDTDIESGDMRVVMGEITQTSDEDYSFIKSCIYDSVSKMDARTIEKIMEPEDTQVETGQG